MKNLFIISLFIFWTTVISVIFLYAHKEHPIDVNYRNRQLQTIFLPQGWAFFTKDPRQDKIAIYRLKENEKVLKRIEFIGNRKKELLGLVRTSRLVALEVSIITESLKGKSSLKCHPLETQCFTKVLASDAIPIKSNHFRFLCGKFILTKSSRIPWAWSRSSSIKAPKKVYSIKIQCNKKLNGEHNV